MLHSFLVTLLVLSMGGILLNTVATHFGGGKSCVFPAFFIFLFFYFNTNAASVFKFLKEPVCEIFSSVCCS